MGKKEILKKLKSKEIRKVFDENNIKHLYLIGSYARGDNTEKSDIDILYKHSKESKITLFDIIGIKSFLEKKFKKDFDISDIDYLNKHYRKNILESKILIF